MVLGRLSAVVLAIVAALAVSIFTWDKAQGETYEQVVDNSDGDRFEASDSWKKSDSGEGISGKAYRVAAPKKETMRSQGSQSGAVAAYRMEIPTDGEYAVYARWPDARGLNRSTRVEVATAEGFETTEVDQTRNGGRWVRVGTYEMEQSDDYSVRISRDTDGKGNVAADAVKIVRMSSSAPAEEQGGDTARTGSSSSGGGTGAERTAARASAGDRVIGVARRFGGRPYDYSHTNCSRRRMACTCFTRLSFAPFLGRDLTLNSEEGQANRGRPVSRSNLRRGDLVYFSEGGGRNVTHVGIYAGGGYLWHSSSYFGEVVRSEMRYIRGYAGARRLV